MGTHKDCCCISLRSWLCCIVAALITSFTLGLTDYAIHLSARSMVSLLSEPSTLTRAIITNVRLAFAGNSHLPKEGSCQRMQESALLYQYQWPQKRLYLYRRKVGMNSWLTVLLANCTLSGKVLYFKQFKQHFCHYYLQQLADPC